MAINAAHAEDNIYQLEEVIVTGKSPQRYLETPASSVTVIQREQIEQMQVENLSEVLELSGAVDITHKAMSQADVSIRGSSTEGVLLLIDGVRVHDPQTGHFLMDIPVPLDAVERVEILHGGGSSIYGSAASGGVINIVTGDTANNGSLGLSMGSFGSRDVNASYGLGNDNTNLTVNFQKSVSDGYRNDSDYDHTMASITGKSISRKLVLKWTVGVVDKKFGAADFYSPHPSYEKVNTVSAGVNAAYVINEQNMFRFRAGGRGHGDDFILVRDDPALYRNTHFNRNYSVSSEFHHESELYNFTFGIETERYGITSGSLGNRVDYYSACYSEMLTSIGIGSVSLSIRYDNGENDGVFSPGAGLIIPIRDNLALRARSNRSFRRPTYTERYYASPSNVGDPALDPELSTMYEGGIQFRDEFITAELTGYRRNAQDTIDWIRYDEMEPWCAINHGRIITTGIEGAISVLLPATYQLSLRFSGLDQKLTGSFDGESKYALNPAEFSTGMALYGPCIADSRFSVIARYEKLAITGARLPVAMRLSRSFGGIMLKAAVENITDDQYEELPGLPAPGRHYSVHMEYSI